MAENVWTQQQAHIIAWDYNIVPFEPLKCERIIPTTTLRSLLFADVPNVVQCLVQYDRDELIYP